MKKRIVFLMAVLTALMLCTGALAEPDAEDLYGQVTSLLFYTSNVTLKVKADFSLNGEWFKTLDGLWKQDSDRSFRQVLLTAPKMDGTELHNGYTLITAGNEYNVMEVYHAGLYKTGSLAERTSILRNTAETDLLIRMGRGIVALVKDQPGVSVAADSADGSIRIAVDGNAPELISTMVNQLAQFAVKRYFSIDADTLKADSEASVWYYNTIAEGLMCCMREIRLQSLTATVKPDANGWISQADGEIRLEVETPEDGTLLLGIKFEAEVSDRGSTMVRKFNPDDYNVIPAGEEYAVQPGNIEYMSGDMIDGLTTRAKEYWKLTGYSIGKIVADSVEHTSEGLNRLYFIMEDGTALCTSYNDMNTCVVMDTEPHAWEGMEIDYEFDPKVDEDQNAKIKAMLYSFLQQVNPDLSERMQNLGMTLYADRRYVINGVTFIDYREEPLDQDDDGVALTVRMGPEPWIEYYAAVSNG